MILFRPVGEQELALIEETGYTRFPPRLPEQPIFYPVLNQQYAGEIAARWNTGDKNSGYRGYVLRFAVKDDYISRFTVQTVGAAHHQEYWIPAGELAEFNDHIQGKIEVIRVYEPQDGLGMHQEASAGCRGGHGGGSAEECGLYASLRLEQVDIPEHYVELVEKDGQWEYEVYEAFYLIIQQTQKGLDYGFDLDPFRDEGAEMERLNRALASEGYETNGYGWEEYLTRYLQRQDPSLAARISPDSEADTCGLYLSSGLSDYRRMLALISTAIRELAGTAGMKMGS